MDGRSLVGKKIVWSRGANTLIGTALKYDEADDEIYINSGIIHSHIWVPASECRIQEITLGEIHEALQNLVSLGATVASIKFALEKVEE